MATKANGITDCVRGSNSHNIKMKQLIIYILFLFSLTAAYSQKNCEYSKEYIPKNITDALCYLNCVWSDEDKENFKNQNEDVYFAC